MIIDWSYWMIVRNFLDKDEPEIEKDSLILPIIKQSKSKQ
jgi:hypothetical protein